MPNWGTIGKGLIIIGLISLGTLNLSTVILPHPIDRSWLTPGQTFHYHGTVIRRIYEGNESHEGGLDWTVREMNATGVYVNITLYYHIKIGQTIFATIRERWNVSFTEDAISTTLWNFQSGAIQLADCFVGSMRAVTWVSPPSEGWCLLQETMRAVAQWNNNSFDSIFDASHGIALDISYSYGEDLEKRWVDVELQEPSIDLGPLRVQEETVFWAGVGLIIIGILATALLGAYPIIRQRRIYNKTRNID